MNQVSFLSTSGTWPVHHLPELVDVGEHLIMADEIPVDDHDGGWKETRAALI